MVSIEQARPLAVQLFDDAYTIERREFADGDSRTEIKHSVGVSATCYITVRVWVGRAEVWIEYFEDDTRRCREIMPFEEFDADRDPAAYLW